MPSSKTALPRSRPLRFTPGYTPPGTKRKLLGWAYAERRLRAAHNYWVCTTRPDRRPHAAPVWGLWLDGAFYFSTDPSSRKARNLASRKDLIVHLESGDEVVILEGKAAPCALTKRIDSAYRRKYGVALIGFPAPMVVLKVRPKVVMAWREKAFPGSATYWKLG